jgi:hypothetical protein
MTERRVSYRVMLEKTEGERPIGKPRRIWEERWIWLRIGAGGGHL